MIDIETATPKECRAWLAEEKKRCDEFERNRLAELKRNECHTNCRDCGRLVEKSRWLRKDSWWAVHEGRRPLCHRCHDEYDDILY